MKKVLIAGSSGMIGNLVKHYCIQNPSITEIICLVRKKSTIRFPKVKEVIVADFDNYTSLDEDFSQVDIAFFCIGAYTGTVKDDLFKKITVDFAVSFAQKIKELSPKASLCLLSGQGADRSEKSKMAFAKYKGMAENQIDGLDLNFYTFRPGYIYPVTKREEPNLMYKVSRFLHPVFRALGKNMSVKSTELAQVMVKVGLEGYETSIIENKDIRAIAEKIKL
jgi:nucleoside-diphosphate-sugar epimerase